MLCRLSSELIFGYVLFGEPLLQGPASASRSLEAHLGADSEKRASVGETRGLAVGLETSQGSGRREGEERRLEKSCVGRQRSPMFLSPRYVDGSNHSISSP